MHPAAQASSALGWVSIACWILVYTPQIVENYQLQSGEGLSVLFVLIWLAGDICNLLGAGIAGLIPTVIILAIYYTICDLILLFQIYYYRIYEDNSSSDTFLESAISSSPDTLVATTPILQSEQTPLLPLSEAQNLKVTFSTLNPTRAPGFLPGWLYQSLQYIGGLTFVTLAGLAAWWVAGQGGDDGESSEVFDWTSQSLGWASAAMYIGSRIPQIIKNRETKCTGLSLALFLFAILGNVTYVLSICVISMSREHLVLSAPWLAGSGLTILLDFFVLGQFFYYRGEKVAFHHGEMHDPAVLHGSKATGQAFAARRFQSTTGGSTPPTTAPPAPHTTGTTDNTAVTELQSQDITTFGELAHAYECSGAPAQLLHRPVRIYQPTRNTMQSGGAKGEKWRIDWDTLPGSGRWENPLMGWASSADYMQGTRMSFNSKDDAVMFAEKQGWDYYVQPPTIKRIPPKNYAENYVYKPHKLRIARTK